MATDIDLPNIGTAEIRKTPEETNQITASSRSCLVMDAGTSNFSSSARASVKTPMMSTTTPRSNSHDEDAVSNRATGGGLAVLPSLRILKMNGSRITAKRRMQLSRNVALVSMGNAGARGAACMPERKTETRQ